MGKTTFVAVAVVAALGGIAAQTTVLETTGVSAATSFSESVARTPARGAKPTSTMTLDGSTVGIYDPSASGIPSDGGVISASRTYSYTATSLGPADRQEWDAARADMNRIEAVQEGWNTALLVMGCVTTITLIITVLTARTHRKIRRESAAIRRGEVPYRKPRQAREVRSVGEDKTGLPAYSSERPPAYSSPRPGSASSLAPLVVAAGAALPRAAAVRTYTTDRAYATTTLTTAEWEGYPGYAVDRAAALQRLHGAQAGLFAGMVGPCVVMWVYIAYVAVIARRHTRKKEEWQATQAAADEQRAGSV